MHCASEHAALMSIPQGTVHIRGQCALVLPQMCQIPVVPCKSTEMPDLWGSPGCLIEGSLSATGKDACRAGPTPSG